MTLQDAVEQEAAAAHEAVPRLADAAVTAALARAAERVRGERDAILEANEADVAAAAELDAGALDRLRLDDGRLEAIAAQLRDLAALPPLEREIDSWRLPNGLAVSERRIPIGVVGANF